MIEKLEERKTHRILEIVQQEGLIKNLRAQLIQAEITLTSMKGGVVEINTLINDIKEEEQLKQKPEKEPEKEPKQDKIIKKKKQQQS